MSIILASASPRRKELMQMLGVEDLRIVPALGEEKAEAAFKMLYARTDSAVPAAFLQLPSRVTVYLDEAAGAKL